MIAIVDYKMINLGSILNMLRKVGAKDVHLVSSPEELTKASMVIMPGVGHYDSAIRNLEQANLIPILKKKALEEKIPFLGICLGMQLMTKFSEEGSLPGLGLIDAKVLKFNTEIPGIKVPHMGWNQAQPKKISKLFTNEELRRFYFVHSYYVECENSEDILAITSHGQDFVSSFEKENLIGVQFHPEKSHAHGLELFKNFIEKY